MRAWQCCLVAEGVVGILLIPSAVSDTAHGGEICAPHHLRDKSALPARLAALQNRSCAYASLMDTSS